MHTMLPTDFLQHNIYRYRILIPLHIIYWRDPLHAALLYTYRYSTLPLEGHRAIQAILFWDFGRDTCYWTFSVILVSFVFFHVLDPYRKVCLK